MDLIGGRAWVFGDDVDTDAIAPSRYLTLPDEHEMASHTMEPIRPGFAAQVTRGDVLIAGLNFGCGSSREQAVRVIKTLGFPAIVAESFGRIFFRNAINDGLIVLECPGISRAAREGERVEIEVRNGKVRTSGQELVCTSLPAFLMDIVMAGGLVPYLLAKEARS